MRKSRAPEIDVGVGTDTKGPRGDDVDALFKLPLAEFIGARNDLVASLKREGRADEANVVKALTKPPISAWAVNQLYWKHREAFDRLLDAGQQFRQAQTSNNASRIADIRESLDARSAALAHLSDLAIVVLGDAGHSPTPDTLHRITTTLEGVSAHSTPTDGPTPGRLTQDVDPPGFESLASLIPGNFATTQAVKSKKVSTAPESGSAVAKTPQPTSPDRDVQKIRQAEETSRARIAAAKVSLQQARRSLTQAQSRAQRLEVSQKKAQADAKKADAEVRQAEKQLRKAEDLLKKASVASQDAAERAQNIAAEAKEAAQAVSDARSAIETASKELDSLLKEESATG